MSQGQRCRIFTYKEGILSAVAHDLEIEVGDFRVEVAADQSQVTASFEARSVKVLHALSNGSPSSSLSEKDKQKIQGNIAGEVLHSARHPQIKFTSKSIRWSKGDAKRGEIEGDLDLHGRSRTIVAQFEETASGWIARAKLHQPDFGITPYSAMMGTLRVKADVDVVVELPKKP